MPYDHIDGMENLFLYAEPLPRFCRGGICEVAVLLSFLRVFPRGGVVVALQSQLLAELILREHDGVGHCVQVGYAVAWLTAASISEFESGLSFVAAGMLPGIPRAVMSFLVTASEPVTIPCASVTSLRNPLVWW